MQEKRLGLIQQLTQELNDPDANKCLVVYFFLLLQRKVFFMVSRWRWSCAILFKQKEGDQTIKELKLIVWQHS